MDLGLGGGRGRSRESEVERGLVEQDCEIGEVSRNSEEVKPRFGFFRALGMVCLRLDLCFCCNAFKVCIFLVFYLFTGLFAMKNELNLVIMFQLESIFGN